MVAMVEGEDTHNAEQETGSTERQPWWKRLWGWTDFGKKKLWDWLQLLGTLAIPVVVAFVGVWFTLEQSKTQQAIEERRGQDEALQAYLDQLSTLLLEEKDLRNDRVRTLLRARTLTVLQRLENPSRKEEVLRFLQEADLVQRVDGKDPVVSLLDAKLQGIGFTGATLHGANLYAANLSDAYLKEAHLRKAILTFANLRKANLSGDNLSGANLRGANLSHANLSDTNLNGAYLVGADLTEANLRGASGVTKEQLEPQVYSVEGAKNIPDTKVLPAQGKFPAGEYVSDEFKPRLSFRVGDGWTVWVWAQETPKNLFIATGPEGGEGGQLRFTKPLRVYDPSNPGGRKLIHAPKNSHKWVLWLQRHPNLESSKPVSVRMGGETGVHGVQIDVTATSKQANCEGDPCVPLFPTADGGEISSGVQDKDRFVFVDVGGKTVVIDAFAPVDKREEFLKKVEKVLDTVEWKGA